MEAQMRVYLPGIIKQELQIQGEAIDESNDYKFMYVAYSCTLLDEDTIKQELQDYVESNNINVFEIKDVEGLTEHILNKHILTENSRHSIKNKESIFRKQTD